MDNMAAMMGGSSTGSCSLHQQDPSETTIEGLRFCPDYLRVRVGAVVSLRTTIQSPTPSPLAIQGASAPAAWPRAGLGDTASTSQEPFLTTAPSTRGCEAEWRSLHGCRREHRAGCGLERG